VQAGGDDNEFMSTPEIKRLVENVSTARRVILEDLKARYKAGDKTVKANTQWSSEYDNVDESGNFFTGAGKLACPVCKTGELRYTRSSYNGHVHAACTTKGCVSWME